MIPLVFDGLHRDLRHLHRRRLRLHGEDLLLSVCVLYLDQNRASDEVFSSTQRTY